MDLATVAVSLVVGLGSGAGGAWITATAHKSTAREARRNQAADALRNYSRVIGDYLEELNLNWDEENEVMTDNGHWHEVQSFDSLYAARKRAYPFKGYLNLDAQMVLEESLWLLPPSPISEAVKQVEERAMTLDWAIQEAFPTDVPRMDPKMLKRLSQRKDS